MFKKEALWLMVFFVGLLVVVPLIAAFQLPMLLK